MKAKLFFAVAIILAATTVANAVTYTYEVDAVTLSGGSITGSFTTTSPDNFASMSNILISASFPGSISAPLAGGSGGPSGVYLPTTINVTFDQLGGVGGRGDVTTLEFTDSQLSGTGHLLLFITPSLLSADYTQWLSYSIGQSISANNSEIVYDVGSVYGYSTVTGQITIAETPLPAALPLFATGLGALGLLGWRKKRKNSGWRCNSEQTKNVA